MNWIVDWWKLLALVLFIAVMLGIGAVAKWGIGNWGWGFTIAGIAFFLVVAWLIDRRSRPGSDLE